MRGARSTRPPDTVSHTGMWRSSVFSCWITSRPSPTELDKVRLVSIAGPLQLWIEKLPTTNMETPSGTESRRLRNILNMSIMRATQSDSYINHHHTISHCHSHVKHYHTVTVMLPHIACPCFNDVIKHFPQGAGAHPDSEAAEAEHKQERC